MARPPGSRRFAYTVVVLLAFCVSVEGVARVVEPEPSDRSVPLPRPGREAEFLAQAARVRDTLGGIAMVPDDASVWGLPADRIVMSGNVPCRINTLGLRGPELPPRATSEDRLLTLGDSTVFGDGVPEPNVFSSVAAASLTRTWQHPVTGVIGGVPGHDSAQSLARLKDKGAAIAPTWVVVANLWSDVYKDNGFARANPTLATIKGPLARSAAYRVTRALLAPFLLRQKVGWIASKSDIGGQDAAGRARVLLKDYLTNLRGIAQATKELGARPAFLALPAPIDLDPAGPPEDVTEYREAMKLVARESGAPYIDGPAWFSEHGGTIGHFADQVHPNAYGHALIGEAIAEALAPLR